MLNGMLYCPKNDKKSLKISILLMKNLSDGEIWIKELKETQKSLKKMYIDKNDKWWQKWHAVIIHWKREKMFS